MMIKVVRKKDSPRINRFSMGDLPSVEFPEGDEPFDIDIRAFPALGEYVELYRPVSAQEKQTKDFILGSGTKSHKIEVK